MEVILKNWTEYQLTNIPDWELELVEDNNEEVITTFTISEEDKVKIYNWCILNADMTVTETQAYLDVIASESKVNKKEAILAIASETDQLNLIASVLDTITSDTPDQAIIDDAKAKFNEIKAILNS